MIRFGALGAAKITPDALLKPCDQEPLAKVRLVAARARLRAEAFALQHKIEAVADDYAALVNDPRIDAVYIALPITQHHEWTLKALRAGKHVLCEKSFASNRFQAQEMAALAATTGLILMDAFHYRYHPIFERAREIYHSQRLGKILSIHAEFKVPITDPEDIRMNYATGGGVTMDIGCYPISWVRHLTSMEPIQIAAHAETGPKDVDLFLATEMIFPGELAITTVGDMRAGVKVSAFIQVIGEAGTMRVNNPIAPHLGSHIELQLNGQTSREHFSRRTTYNYQLDAFIAAIDSRRQPLTGPEDAVRQMTTIDRCYEAAGLPLRGL